MIGIFDSGRGGIASAKHLRKMFPYVDIAYLADRKNSPYGTKQRGELIDLASEDIRRLLELGAEKILIACCTASTVYSALPEKYRSICVPIISPAAKAAATLTKNGRIAVIATEATVRSGAFPYEIKRLKSGIEVCQIACQRLVAVIESRGNSDALEEEITVICKSVRALAADTLILGCTHFSHVRDIFGRQLKKMNVIDSAQTGAMAIPDGIKTKENGKILYT